MNIQELRGISMAIYKSYLLTPTGKVVKNINYFNRGNQKKTFKGECRTQYTINRNDFIYVACNNSSI